MLYEVITSKRTRLEIVTEGVLTRRLQADPELTGIGLVILDEFHERSLHADLALALCRDTQCGLRPELRLLVMSATLAAEPVAALLGGAPVLRSEGRSYVITSYSIHYTKLYEQSRDRRTDRSVGGRPRAGDCARAGRGGPD